MAPRHISREIKEVALKMSQEGASDELIKQYLGISEQAMRPFFFFSFFSYFFSQKNIVSLGKFADRGFRNPASLLTILGWPLVLKTAVNLFLGKPQYVD